MHAMMNKTIQRGAEEFGVVLHRAHKVRERVGRVGFRKTALFYAVPQRHIVYLWHLADCDERGLFDVGEGEFLNLFQAEIIAKVRHIDGEVYGTWAGFTAADVSLSGRAR